MKKSFLNTAITIAFSSAVFSGTVLSTQAYAADPGADNNSNDATTESYLYPGMGVGAASGALVAGPVGFVVGGLIGAIAGANQQISANSEDINKTIPEADTELAANTAREPQAADHTQSSLSESGTLQHGIQLAQLGEMNTVVESGITSQQDTLLDILTADLSLDVYFRSGSSNIESFYPARLAAIADLMNNMNQLELHLDGYTDRRGDKTKNIELANRRIEKVREQLIAAGVDDNRIISNAFGEIKMVSAAGDLEAYTFDRKVVIRFQRITADSIAAMTTALSEAKSKTEATSETENTKAVVADTRIAF